MSFSTSLYGRNLAGIAEVVKSPITAQNDSAVFVEPSSGGDIAVHSSICHVLVKGF